MTGFEEIIFQNKSELITILTAIVGITVGILITIHIPKIEENSITLKKLSQWSIFVLILGVLGIIFIFLFGRMPPTPPAIKEIKPLQEIKPENPRDFDEFTELLENEGYTHKRLILLNEHSGIIPNQISSTDLERILKCFYGDSKRFEVLKALQNLRKLKKSYTEKERSKIKGMFNKNIWDSEVEKWFDGSR